MSIEDDWEARPAARVLSQLWQYESDGGPNAARIVELLRAQSSSPEEDVSSFVDSIIFNWLIAGTDAYPATD
jgi:serine/threonine-protein kinase HipA